MSENVEIIAIGIDNAITIVARTLFKKSSKIKTEIAPPISKFCVTDETDSSIKSDVSMTVVSSAPSGNCSFNSSLLESIARATSTVFRSEEHTSELQSRGHLVCRLLLEKKKTQ